MLNAPRSCGKLEDTQPRSTESWLNANYHEHTLHIYATCNTQHQQNHKASIDYEIERYLRRGR